MASKDMRVSTNTDGTQFMYSEHGSSISLKSVTFNAIGEYYATRLERVQDEDPIRSYYGLYRLRQEAAPLDLGADDRGLPIGAASTPRGSTGIALIKEIRKGELWNFEVVAYESEICSADEAAKALASQLVKKGLAGVAGNLSTLPKIEISRSPSGVGYFQVGNGSLELLSFEHEGRNYRIIQTRMHARALDYGYAQVAKVLGRHGTEEMHAVIWSELVKDAEAWDVNMVSATRNPNEAEILYGEEVGTLGALPSSSLEGDAILRHVRDAFNNLEHQRLENAKEHKRMNDEFFRQ
ncbi:MAG: hypothetical protein KGH60_01050 [Candidatus Micrarchaeota archaeon]|nr:hypothetical protein [Candidatus Micrarchaeota archaeon]